MADSFEIGLSLLHAAGLTMPEAESTHLASVYADLRGGADSLYSVVTDDMLPDLEFDPTFGGSND
jgi:hypothetical protein